MAVDPYGRRQPGVRQNLVPQNTRLWAMLQVQARQKFRQYPSLPASKWIHSEYVKRGGIFVDSKKKDTQHHHGRMTKEGEKEKESQEQQKKTQDTRRKPPKGNKK